MFCGPNIFRTITLLSLAREEGVPNKKENGDEKFMSPLRFHYSLTLIQVIRSELAATGRIRANTTTRSWLCTRVLKVIPHKQLCIQNFYKSKPKPNLALTG